MTIQWVTPFSVHLGVAGAGTMGRGIALTGIQAGMTVTLYDIDPSMLESAREYIEEHLKRKNTLDYSKNLSLSSDLVDFRKAQIVIEAAPEDIEIKQDLFQRLEKICPPPAILATNTSTLAVTAIAAATSSAERVAGMHFFNPAPVMPLVEIIRGAQTSPATIQTLTSLAGRLGKTAVIARDTPGFIVNRVARPFYGEALRILGEGIAGIETIDQTARLGAGFRMGPFQLMDLIGIDTNLAAMQSMYEQTFGEPRYRPHLIQIQMVQQKKLGKKSGHGFYNYLDGATHTETTPPEPVRSRQVIRYVRGNWAPVLADFCRQQGHTLIHADTEQPSQIGLGIVAAGRDEGLRKRVVELDQELQPDTPILCQCADTTLTEIASWIETPQRLIGFDGLFAAGGRAMTLVASPTLTTQARYQASRFANELGKIPHWIEDGPGLILPRLVAMLINEAAFAVMDGVAERDEVDLAMTLGMNYPRGPFAWVQQIGYPQVLAVLDHLHAEYHEDRYRAAPVLRRWARLEQVSA